MKKIYHDTRVLDKKARETYQLTEDIMMENAAAALEKAVMAHAFHPSGRYISRPCILILAGSGNNGADGYALARRVSQHDLSVTVCQVMEPKSPMALLQMERAKNCGVTFIDLYSLDEYIEGKSFDITVCVDCMLGTGTRLPLPPECEAAINSAAALDSIDCYKISCDVPTGLDLLGNAGTDYTGKPCVFECNETVTMGSLKLSLTSDMAKDRAGKITVANLGVSSSCYCSTQKPDAFLLEESELKLPVRTRQNSNKGTYGHAVLVSGEKPGAARIAATAALNFGSGLVTLCGIEDCPDPSLMASMDFPAGTSAIAMGMGLGVENPRLDEYARFLVENKDIPLVLDADLFKTKAIKKILDGRCTEEAAMSGSRACILTPHPKEFSALLANCGFGEYDTRRVIADRFSLAKEFCTAYRNCTLILKGATVLIAYWSRKDNDVQVMFNPWGTAALAKAGSGDVLSGLACALLAQGYDATNAAVTASLVHALSSRKFESSWSLTPMELISRIADFNPAKSKSSDQVAPFISEEP